MKGIRGIYSREGYCRYNPEPKGSLGHAPATVLGLHPAIQLKHVPGAQHTSTHARTHARTHTHTRKYCG